VATGRHTGPIGRLSQREANRSVALMTTITFFGGVRDITDSEAAVLFWPQRNANVLSASNRSTTCRVTPTRSPAGPSPSWVDGSARHHP